jgi:hypothetical protein
MAQRNRRINQHTIYRCIAGGTLSDCNLRAHALQHEKKNNPPPDRYVLLMTDGSMDVTSTKDANRTVRASCEEAKADGFKIFTVGFMAPDIGAKLVKYCGSTPENDDETRTMDRLVAAFLGIAKSTHPIDDDTSQMTTCPVCWAYST